MVTNQVNISPGNIKTGRIPACSVRPVADCPNSCKDCYALKAWKQYPSVRAAWSENSRIAHEDLPKFKEQVINWIEKKRKTPRFFRIHVAGDFFSQDYLNGWKSISAQCDETRFLAFTKAYQLDYSDLPENMRIVFSMWPQLPDTAPKYFPRAYMQDGTEKRIPNYALECPGNCESCGMCWNLELGQAVVFEKH